MRFVPPHRVEMKKLFSQIRTAVAACFAHYAHKKKAEGKWLQANYWPGSLGYEWGGLCLALGELYDELACAIKGAA